MVVFEMSPMERERLDICTDGNAAEENSWKFSNAIRSNRSIWKAIRIVKISRILSFPEILPRKCHRDIASNARRSKRLTLLHDCLPFSRPARTTSTVENEQILTASVIQTFCPRQINFVNVWSVSWEFARAINWRNPNMIRNGAQTLIRFIKSGKFQSGYLPIKGTCQNYRVSRSKFHQRISRCFSTASPAKGEVKIIASSTNDY